MYENDRIILYKKILADKDCSISISNIELGF